jgi:protein-S-isoprenylcysteine O-methyltransferase Ste14
MERSLIITLTAAHVVFRLLYLFYIGGVLRKRTRQGRDQTQLSDWLQFKERASFILHLDVDFFLAVTVLTSCWGGSDCLLNGLLVPDAVWSGLGAVMLLVGGYAKWDAYRIVGDRGWFWYNFFCAPEQTDYEVEGVYKWFDNPMYGVGYLTLLGFALLMLSSWGLVLAFFDWAVIWIFYYFCERPHTEQVLK